MLYQRNIVRLDAIGANGFSFHGRYYRLLQCGHVIGHMSRFGESVFFFLYYYSRSFSRPFKWIYLTALNVRRVPSIQTPCLRKNNVKLIREESFLTRPSPPSRGGYTILTRRFSCTLDWFLFRFFFFIRNKLRYLQWKRMVFL